MSDTHTSDEYFIPAGATADGTFDLVVTPESAGWGYSSLRVLTLQPGQSVEFGTADHEMILLPISGGASVQVDAEEFTLAGRAGVFDGVTDFAYLPIDSTVQVESVAGGVFALPGAKATRRLPFRYGPASGVPVELRGAGNCSRQVNNFATPAVFETDKMIGVEVITPAGNWSSYPPHKHDETSEHESELEEIYYYLFRSQAPQGVGDRPQHRLPARVRNGAAPDRGAPRGHRRRHRARPARLARTVDRGAEPRHVLPQRDGRPRARSELEDLR